MSNTDYTFKVLFFSDPFAGKKDLLNKYTSKFFQEDQDLTLGVEFYLKTIILNDDIIKIQLYVFSEEERFRFLIPSYCRGSKGAIIMYDISDLNSLKQVPEWILIIREYAGDIPIILIGNKLDLEQSREVSREEGMQIAENNNLAAFAEISTKTGENVEKTFEIFTDIIINF